MEPNSGDSLSEHSSMNTSSESENFTNQDEELTSKLKSKLSKPSVFCWQSYAWDNELEEATELSPNPSQDSLQAIIYPESTVITHHEPLSEESWLLNGTLGSRYAILVFKSSSLANSSELAVQEKPGHKLHITYKVLQAETRLLSKILDCHGISEVAPNSSDFNLLWTGSHPKPGTLRSLAPYQRVNHFPRSFELTRKDRLYKNIECMQHTKGLKNFDFIPQTFVMPLEYRELCSAHNRVKGPWIVKPVASSRGRDFGLLNPNENYQKIQFLAVFRTHFSRKPDVEKFYVLIWIQQPKFNSIFIVETPHQVPVDETVVVAKYISKPLLVAGHKCDLRLYIVVTSFDPLVIYIYEEGLVRFATVKYDSSHKQLWNPCMHLCNYSINKYHSDYVKSDDPTAENVGHKWTLSALLRHLKSEGKDTAMLMSQIEDLVIKAILCSANSIISACKMFVPHINNCFELYGFDILIDEDLKPWLLEVNLSPSLNCDSPLDVRLKSAMLADLLTLVGIPAVDPVLRPSNSSTSIKSNNSCKMKLGNCRRVLSADGLSNTLPNRKKPSVSPSIHKPTPNFNPLNPEESRILKNVKSQFERRGGFVRIFPAIDSWEKYTKYLDPVTGIPISSSSSSAYSFNNNVTNLNLLLYQHLFPGVHVAQKGHDGKYSIKSKFTLDTKRESSIDRTAIVKSANGRVDRYERMLSQGHKSALQPKKILKETQNTELRKKVLELLKNGRKVSQFEERKTFSQYLVCVLNRIVAGPSQDDHIEIVLKFLRKASNYVRTPFSVKSPSNKLDIKDRTAIIAKQLNDFLYIYNRETELFVDKSEKSDQIPGDLYADFLNHANESDLEDVLKYLTCQTVPTYKEKPGLQVLKCISNIPKSAGSTRSRYLNTPTKSSGLKVSN